MKLAKQVYKLTKAFPDDKKFGLVSQMRRCAVSIPSNIAEGAERGTDSQFAHFLAISQGSAFELETQLLLSQAMELGSIDDIKGAIEKVQYIQKMNFNLKQTLKTK